MRAELPEYRYLRSASKHRRYKFLREAQVLVVIDGLNQAIAEPLSRPFASLGPHDATLAGLACNLIDAQH